MFQFGVFAALMLLIALCIVLIPLLTKRHAQTVDRSTNVKLARQKLHDLQAEFSAGSLDQAQFDQAREELELSLYQDLQSETVPVFDENKGRWLALPLGLGLPLLALALYSVFGDSRSFDPDIAKAQTPATAVAGDRASQMQQINAMVDKLATRLEKEPDDAEGWMRLGHSYKVLQRYPEAVKALRKAQELMGDKPDVLLQLADAIAMANGGSLKGDAAALIAKALTLEPEHNMGLWLSGMVSAEAGDFPQAIKQWGRLQKQYKPEDSEYKEVQDLIDKANARLGKPAEASVAAKSENAPSAKTASVSGSVKVKIELAASLQSQVKPEDSVIIYAQAVNGPKAPLAAVKRQVKDLPLEITLDDSMAMMPAMTISSVDHIRISARIGAGAIPQPGEPLGSIELQGADRAGLKSILISGTVN